MFGLGKFKSPQPLSCLLSDYGYSLVGLADNQHILFCEEHHFTEPSPTIIAHHLKEDVNKHHLVGRSCQVILAPNLYQLLLVDPPEVPENELSKALRWQLKGLVDYPLSDIVIDTFIVPPHGAGEKRKKAFVAVTLQSALINRVSILESCLLNVTAVSISELALSKLLSLEPISTKPSIVISYNDEGCQHLVYYMEDLYLLRTLPVDKTIIQPNSSANQDMLLEIQRSIDYCLIELKLPEPKQIFFTPSFYKATDLFTYLQTELNKEVKLLDINSFFMSDPIAPEIMEKVFYAIGGALMFLDKENES
jgi:MSHA biogenesis protein MshI